MLFENPFNNKKSTEQIEKSIESFADLDFDTQVGKLGSLLHDEWRAPRIKEDGSFEERIKTTSDESWIQENGLNEVDIANTSYEDLPEDWKGENKISAEITLRQIHEAVDNSESLDENFVEKASSVLHDKWLERNGDWASEEQKLPYEDLSEEEKEKDRVIIRKGISLYNN